MYDERREFANTKRQSFTAEVEPWGSVEVEPRDDVVVLVAQVGGWAWQASGADRATALRRLEKRLAELNPFYGFDTGWGMPGEANGDSQAEAIPEEVRARMRAFQAQLDPNVLPDEDE